MPDADSISANLDEVRRKMEAAAARAGRPAADVLLLAVSKTWPAEIVRLAVEAGQRHFGENKVQEGLEKAPLLPSSLEWHLIGRLQKNKVRKALTVFPIIHGIDSLELAQAVDRIAGEEGGRPEVYLQINLAEESSKSGFTREGVRRDLEEILALPRLTLQGLMIIPPISEEAEGTRRWFAGLREFRDELEKRAGVSLPGLSMGMSHDYEVAIEEGATVVRVGSSIFGGRKSGGAP